MKQFIGTVGDFAIYELDKKECYQNYREYPCYVCWDKLDLEDIGDLRLTLNETGTLEEMLKWCEKYSYRN